MVVIPGRVETYEASPVIAPSLLTGQNVQATALGRGIRVEPRSIRE